MKGLTHTCTLDQQQTSLVSPNPESACFLGEVKTCRNRRSHKLALFRLTQLAQWIAFSSLLLPTNALLYGPYDTPPGDRRSPIENGSHQHRLVEIQGFFWCLFSNLARIQRSRIAARMLKMKNVVRRRFLGGTHLPMASAGLSVSGT